MRVLLFYINLNQGGVQRMMVNIANNLAERGYMVDIYLAKNEGHYLNLLNDKIKVNSANTNSRLKLIFKLALYLKSNKYDVVFTAVPHFNIIGILAKYLAFSKAKIIISERSNTFEEFRQSPLGFYKLSFLLIPILYRFANEIVAVSNGVAVDLAKAAIIKRSRITVIYNPAYNDEMINTSKLEVHHPWFANRKHKLIISVGRLTKQKDFPTLINSMNYLNDLDVKLLIVGEGEELQFLKQLICDKNLENKVELVGFQKDPVAWISKCDVFVLASIWEGFGNILVEALAAGTTIVTTDCKSGPSEILNNGTYGYLTPVGQSKEMAEQIRQALLNPFDTELLRLRAQEFGVNAVLDQYRELFHR
jgi:glycosyltransferase involved in cell wall biosynthesis